MEEGSLSDEEVSRQAATHQVGDRLDDLSVSELENRILILRDEIVRLEAAKSQKQSAAAAALSFFKT